ncbi:MAG: DoxX family protein [Aeromicrobium erythreum]
MSTSTSTPVDHRATSRGGGLTTDLGLLVARVALGVVFVAHGLQKWTQGITGTQDGFAAMGVPLPELSAVALASLEVGGGALLVLGALTRVVAALLGAAMVGAAWFAHRDAFFVADGGLEFAAVLAAVGLALALTGPGRLAVDSVVAGRR